VVGFLRAHAKPDNSGYKLVYFDKDRYFGFFVGT